MMESSRAFAGKIARLFGFSEEHGFKTVQDLQQRGLISRGTGGGFGARPVTVNEAALIGVAIGLSLTQRSLEDRLDFMSGAMRPGDAKTTD